MTWKPSLKRVRCTWLVGQISQNQWAKLLGNFATKVSYQKLLNKSPVEVEVLFLTSTPSTRQAPGRCLLHNFGDFCCALSVSLSRISSEGVLCAIEGCPLKKALNGQEPFRSIWHLGSTGQHVLKAGAIQDSFPLFCGTWWIQTMAVPEPHWREMGTNAPANRAQQNGRSTVFTRFQPHIILECYCHKKSSWRVKYSRVASEWQKGE